MGFGDLPHDVLRGPLLDALLGAGCQDHDGAGALRLASAAFAVATRERLPGVVRVRAERVVADLLPRYRGYPGRVACGPCFWDDNPRQVRMVTLRLPRAGLLADTLFFVERILDHRRGRTDWWVRTRPGAQESESVLVRIKDPPEAA